MPKTENNPPSRHFFDFIAAWVAHSALCWPDRYLLIFQGQQKGRIGLNV